MTRHDGRLRARDADRDRVVELLGKAYVDGQLSEADRELRVSRALAARTLDELDVLVRDLQGHDVVPRPTTGRTGPAVGVAAAVIALVVVGLILFRTGDDDTGPTEPVAAPPPVEQVALPEVAEPVEFVPAALSRVWFESFLSEYEAEFGDTMILDAGFRQGGFVHFKRPVNDERPDVLQNWDWYPDRGFERSIVSASHDPFGYAQADLSAINLDRLLAEIDHGRQFLGVDNPDMDVFVSPHIGDEPQLIMITAGNSYGDTGRRWITFDGRVTESSPFVIGRSQ